MNEIRLCMRPIRNDRGAVIVFITLMIVLLLIMVGLGLDTGQLTYSRSQGQAAVDSAALAAVSGLPEGLRIGNDGPITQRVAAFNTSNDYIKNASNPIGSANITYVLYDELAGTISSLPDMTKANGVRVALEGGRAINTPTFLAPLMNLFGQSIPTSTDVNVSAVAALKAIPSVPIAIMNKVCAGPNPVNLRDQSVVDTDNACWTTYTDPVSTSAVRTLFGASATCSGLPANMDSIASGSVIGLSDDLGNVPDLYSAAKELFLNNSSTQWIVPVIPDSGNCPTSAPIIGWARVNSISVATSEGSKNIKVNFTCNQKLFRPADNLCFSPRLVRDTNSGM